MSCIYEKISSSGFIIQVHLDRFDDVILHHQHHVIHMQKSNSDANKLGVFVCSLQSSGEKVSLIIPHWCRAASCSDPTLFLPPQHPWKTPYLHNEVDVGGESLHSVETGDESNRQEALLIHLPPQEEVPLQVVKAKVVLTRSSEETSSSLSGTYGCVDCRLLPTSHFV